MIHHQVKGVRVQRLLAGGSALLALVLMLDIGGLPSFGLRKTAGEACKESVQPTAKLSRQQLAKLLTIPEGDRKQRVQEILKTPFCKLADLQVRAGATAQREAYPLEFDPQTWLVILYEGDQYVGYRFNPR
jgi:hypothetical protein